MTAGARPTANSCSGVRSSSSPAGTRATVERTTGIVVGSAYGAHVSPAPLVTPYVAYIASFSSTSSEVCRDSRK
jgi:hypothetical protein